MKITIATPLYPPEIGGSATYVKELAKKLSAKHQITIVLYGRLPEKIPGVSFICINKFKPLPIRLLFFIFALWKAAIKTDILYVENGASVELPAVIASFFTRRQFILHIGDEKERRKSQKKPLLNFIERVAANRSRRIIGTSPLPRPEFLPFKPKPQKEFENYEKSWTEHIKNLEKLFIHD